MVKQNKMQASAPEKKSPAPRSAQPMRDTSLPKLSVIEIGSYLLMFAAMWATLRLKLLGALLAGILVYQLIHAIVPAIERHMSSQRARWVAVVLLSTVIVSALAGLVIGIIEHFEDTVPNMQHLLDQVMQIIEGARLRMPDWIASMLPTDVTQMKAKASVLIHSHIDQLKQSGKNVARGFGHVLFGMIIGAMIAVASQNPLRNLPLAATLAIRIKHFADAFRRIVFAQFKISAINAMFTAIYLLVVLPLFHERLPLSLTLVLITFITGLLPVVGNLISNTLIVAVSLSINLPTAIASLVFLVLIHKLEYFLNAKIIGGQIEAHAWELLLAMLVMEAAFGVYGVIAAPIFYAYIKRELIVLRLI